MATGTRKKEDPLNTHGTGYHEGDAVQIKDEGATVKGIVRAVHGDGKRVDVHIGHSGHKNNGRVVTVGLDDVRPLGKQHDDEE